MTVFARTQTMFRKNPHISQNQCTTAPLDALSPLLLTDQQMFLDSRHPPAIFVSISGRSL
jgi:hypothetical protein